MPENKFLLLVQLLPSKKDHAQLKGEENYHPYKIPQLSPPLPLQKIMVRPS